MREQLSRREFVFRRFRGLCFYCTRALELDESTVDHWLPRVLGGKNRRPNMVLACMACNNAKGCVNPAEYGVASFRQNDTAALLFRELVVSRALIPVPAFTLGQGSTIAVRAPAQASIRL